MGRKKKTEEDITDEEVIESPKKEKRNVFDEFKDVFLSANSIISKPKKVIPVSPYLDTILYGIPEGCFMLIAGKHKLGKTTTALSFSANCQKYKKRIYYFDVEHRLKERDLNGINGLSLKEEDFQVIQSVKGHILRSEDYLDILMKLVSTEEDCVLIMDSVSQLCSGERAATDIGDRFRDNVPLQLANLTKQIGPPLALNNNIFVGITHMIANQGQGHSKWLEASGNKIQYQADIKLKATYSEPYIVNNKQIGQIIHWECGTNAIGPPGGSCQSLLRYDYGIDREYELGMLAIDLGFIQKGGGGWCTFPDNSKEQGVENVCERLKNDKDLYDDLNKQCREMMGITIKEL